MAGEQCERTAERPPPPSAPAAAAGQLLVSERGVPLVLTTGAQLQHDDDFAFTTVQPIHQGHAQPGGWGRDQQAEVLVLLALVY